MAKKKEKKRTNYKALLVRANESIERLESERDVLARKASSWDMFVEAIVSDAEFKQAVTEIAEDEVNVAIEDLQVSR